MRKQSGVSLVEIAMMFVVISIVAVVALPTVNSGSKLLKTKPINSLESANKVKSAYAIAIAETGDYPRLSEVVEYIDADFASEKSDFSGILFRDGRSRLTINTFRDAGCKLLTNDSEPGVTDVVRCI